MLCRVVQSTNSFVLDLNTTATRRLLGSILIMAPTLLDSISISSYVLVAGVAALAFSVLHALRFFRGK